jgi:hypothetical protein
MNEVIVRVSHYFQNFLQGTSVVYSGASRDETKVFVFVYSRKFLRNMKYENNKNVK